MQPRIEPFTSSELTAYEQALTQLEQVEDMLKTIKSTLLSRESCWPVQEPGFCAQKIRRLLKARRARQNFFVENLFADPAWDILLEAYAASIERRRTSVTALCAASAVPSTTALRWINKLQEEGLLRRDIDPLDHRRSWMAISPQGATAMRGYLNAISISLPL